MSNKLVFRNFRYELSIESSSNHDSSRKSKINYRFGAAEPRS